MSHKDMKELREAIELKSKLGKLDSLLLFVPTLLGLVFSLLQYGLGLIKQPIDITLLVPVLLLGIGLPVYVGYYRGGLKLDSITERARGWIYLVAGLSLYLSSVLRTPLETWLPNASWLARVVPLVMSAFTGYVSSGIGPGIMALFGKKPSQRDTTNFRATAFAAFLLAISFMVAIDHLRSMMEGKAKLLTGVTYIANWTVFFHVVLMLELSARETILEGLWSRMTAVKSTLTVFGSISPLLVVVSLDGISRSFPGYSEILLIIALVLLGGYVTLTAILVKKEIRRSSVARQSSKPAR